MQNYTHQIKSSIDLDTILEDEIAKKFIGSIYWNYLFNHGLMKYTYLDGTEISKDAILKQGDKFRVNQPELQGDDFSIQEVLECDMDNKSEKFIRLIARDLTAKSPLKAAELTITYRTQDPEKNNNPSITHHFQCIPNHNSVVKLTEISNQTMLKRIKRLSEDPENVFRELELISDLDFKYVSDDAQLPHGVNAKISIPTAANAIRKGINQYKFLCKLFSDIVRNNEIDSDCPFDQINTIMVKIPSLSWNLDKTLNEVNFILELSDSGLTLSSATKIDIFGNMRYEILFLAKDEATTCVQLGIMYNGKTFKSGLASTVSSAVNYFKKETLPDPTLIMKFRARLMLDTFIRHFVEYMRKELSLIVEPHVELSQSNKRLSK